MRLTCQRRAISHPEWCVARAARRVSCELPVAVGNSPHLSNPQRGPMAPARNMTRHARSLVLLMSLVVTLALVACGRDDRAPTALPLEYVPGELLVELPPGVADSIVERRLAEQGLVLVRVTGTDSRHGLVRVPVDGEDYWVAELIRQGLAVTAERNAIVRVS
jgi:hypothetical protein